MEWTPTRTPGTGPAGSVREADHRKRARRGHLGKCPLSFAGTRGGFGRLVSQWKGIQGLGCRTEAGCQLLVGPLPAGGLTGKAPDDLHGTEPAYSPPIPLFPNEPKPTSWRGASPSWQDDASNGLGKKGALGDCTCAKDF